MPSKKKNRKKSSIQLENIQLYAACFIEMLAEEGVLRKYILDGKSSACYQYLGEHATCQEHFHLKCLSCGTLFHVQCTFLDEMQAHIAAHHHFQIDHTKTVLYGYCEQCQNAQQKKES